MENIIVTKKEFINSGLKSVDYIIVSGDAYVDHPSFGTAIIARVLEHNGYSVAVCAQPNWQNHADITMYGEPNLAFLVTSGNIDSMVNNYSVTRNKRKVDIYTPNGSNDKRPNRAVIVYSNLIRQVYKDCAIIIGGIEASLRRLAHYDYWSDSVRRSILLDSKADLLVYGMAEKTIVEIAEYLKSGLNVNDITFVNGTAYKTNDIENVYNKKVLPTYEEIISNKLKYNESFKEQYYASVSYEDIRLVENYGSLNVVVNPAPTPLNEEELDSLYKYPFTYKAHPSYNKIGEILALDEVQLSISANRGCFASCNFCAITFHQGRIVTSRSVSSVVEEARKITKLDTFKGNINDIGGPTANFLEYACDKQKSCKPCKTKKCISTELCKKLNVNHDKYLEMLKQVEDLEGVKKVFIRSGIRYDYVLKDRNRDFMKKLVKDHVSGQLRLAPEHVDNETLRLMGKPDRSVYDKFVKDFNVLSERYKKEQYVVPYLMSSHPGCDLNAAIELACYLNEINHQPLQVQDFYPTPGTLSTCMYYTGYHPITNEKVYVAKTEKEKKMQRALLQFKDPKNEELVIEALTIAKRKDLIGNKKECLINTNKSYTKRY